MRRSVYILAVATCLASPTAAAQRADGPPAVATAEPVAATHATTPGSPSPAKSRSAFGQAMNELIRSVSESRTKPDIPIATNPMAGPGVADDAPAPAGDTSLAHAVPATAPSGERAVSAAAAAAPADAEAPLADGERQVALQSGPDDPR